jgi:hypothetical protein
MNWTGAQLAEALEHIHAIEESQLTMRQDIAEIRGSLIRMRELLDQAIVEFTPRKLETGSPSICPEPIT